MYSVTIIFLFINDLDIFCKKLQELFFQPIKAFKHIDIYNIVLKIGVPLKILTQ